DGDKETGFNGKIPKTNIQVMATPGHAHEHAALLVETKMGKVAIAGDLFWWNDQEKQKIDIKSLMNKKDPYVKSWPELKASRHKILQIADYIIPGHGKMFKVK
ncbi:MAG: hypothetical protein NTY61_01905, partial [Candidatus Parcubacteria bacterium]|nr:hypothetical protein [Candidatus Parcubacteria bacterium]